MPMTKIGVPCVKCGKEFKTVAVKIRGGATIRCPACGNAVTFDSASPDAGVRKALSLARQARLRAVKTN